MATERETQLDRLKKRARPEEVRAWAASLALACAEDLSRAARDLAVLEDWELEGKLGFRDDMYAWTDARNRYVKARDSLLGAAGDLRALAEGLYVGRYVDGAVQ